MIGKQIHVEVMASLLQYMLQIEKPLDTKTTL
jgi:hypothetical protein